MGDTLIIDEEDDESSTRWTEQDTPGDIWNYINEEQDQIPDVGSEVWSEPSVSSGSVAEEVVNSSDGDFHDLGNADSM